MARGGDTRFGQARENPQVRGRGHGAWKKSETKRKIFEDIIDMSVEDYKQLVEKPSHSVFESLAIKAINKSFADKGFDVDKFLRLIDGFEPKPAQKIEVAELPEVKPFMDIRVGRHAE